MFLDIGAELHWAGGQIAIFFQKNCIFRAEKGFFSKSSFYTKMFSDPKYSFSVCQKKFFWSNPKLIFNQIQPRYLARTFDIQIVEVQLSVLCK